MDARLGGLAQDGTARAHRLDVLDTPRGPVIGGLGVLVTVLVAVFGFFRYLTPRTRRRIERIVSAEQASHGLG